MGTVAVVDICRLAILWNSSEQNLMNTTVFTDNYI